MVANNYIGIDKDTTNINTIKQLVLDTRKNVIELQSEDDITLDFAKTLMNSLGLPKEVTDNELNYYVFLDYCKKVYKYSKVVLEKVRICEYV